MTDVFREEYRELSETEQSDIADIKGAAQRLYEVIDSHSSSREISIAKTKVEEAVMWAVKAITQ